MDYPSLVIGAMALGFGGYTGYLRFRTPEKLRKLDAMKKLWGARAGTVIHTIAYTVFPALVGLIFLYAGITGVSVFDLAGS